MPFVHVRSRKIHYVLEGQGDQVLMFANSLGASVEMWAQQAHTLSAEFRVLRFDARGHGLSDPDGSLANVGDLAADALAVMDQVGARRVHFIGLSLGGIIGQQLALEFPDRLASLTLCATGAALHPPEAWERRAMIALSSGLEPLVEISKERWFTPQFQAQQPEQVQRLLQCLAQVDQASYASCCRAIRDFDARADIHRITTPMLLIAGENDSATPITLLQEIQRLAPSSRLIVVGPAAHILNVEQPERVSAEIRGFISALSQNAGMLRIA